MSLANFLTSKLGLHPPARLTSIPGMTPQKLKVITVLVLTAVFRITFILLSNIYSIPAYLVLMKVLTPLKLCASDVYWYIEGILFRWLQLLVAWWMWSAGYAVEICGDDMTEIEDEETMLLVNHQSSADVPALMYCFQSYNRVLDKILWIMDVMFKKTNFGFVSRCHRDFFIQCGKETRHLQPKRLRQHLLDTHIPLKREWVVVFPEGGFLWKQKKRCQEYAKKNGFPHLENCSLPRTGALETILETLNVEAKAQSIKWVVDVTIAYPQGRPLNFQTIIIGQRDPMVTTINYRKYPITEIPFDSEGLRNWLFDRYVEKDKMLETFHKTGKFPIPSKISSTYKKETQRKELSYWMVLFINVFFICLTAVELYALFNILCMVQAFLVMFVSLLGI